MKWWTEIKYNWHYAGEYFKAKALRFLIVLGIFGVFVWLVILQGCGYSCLTFDPFDSPYKEWVYFDCVEQYAKVDYGQLRESYDHRYMLFYREQETDNGVCTYTEFSPGKEIYLYDPRRTDFKKCMSVIRGYLALKDD